MHPDRPTPAPLPQTRQWTALQQRRGSTRGAADREVHEHLVAELRLRRLWPETMRACLVRASAADPATPDLPTPAPEEALQAMRDALGLDAGALAGWAREHDLDERGLVRFATTQVRLQALLDSRAEGALHHLEDHLRVVGLRDELMETARRRARARAAGLTSGLTPDELWTRHLDEHGLPPETDPSVLAADLGVDTAGLVRELDLHATATAGDLAAVPAAVPGTEERP
ncbi:hypothetical protein GCM10025883_35220 [Mobilicoccus caccae]|uniref:Uncharacterized protein n=2 Tax=Mobilicoccus caccae TaxID=1859295 RepID=A0ABQ6IWF7_9MICO|nr:hypothetical protein GCM10025883_35220 [Mobilicoccus caccae]